MSLCENGRWHADACRCFKFWTGTACDRRLCARGAGILRPDDGLCRCRPGFGGEFCQYEICRHEHQWFCNTTEMAPPTIWDDEEEKQARPPALCHEEILRLWFNPPQSITPAWYCSCGSGYREGVVNGTELLSSICACDGGHFGRFCENNICSANGSIWNSENATCVVPIKIRDPGTGFFGFQINDELTGATIAVFTLIALFLVIGRCYIRKLDRDARELEEHDLKTQRLRRKYRARAIRDGAGFGSRHYSTYGQYYSSILTEAGSPRTSIRSIRSGGPAKRKQGNLTPLTPPPRRFDYKAFYAAGPLLGRTVSESESNVKFENI